MFYYSSTATHCFNVYCVDVVAGNESTDVVEITPSMIPLVTALLGPRMLASRAEFSRLTTRRDRLLFLRRRLTNSESELMTTQLDGDDQKLTSNAELPLRQGRLTIAQRRPRGIFAIKPDDWNKQEAHALGRLVTSRAAHIDTDGNEPSDELGQEIGSSMYLLAMSDNPLTDSLKQTGNLAVIASTSSNLGPGRDSVGGRLMTWFRRLFRQGPAKSGSVAPAQSS